MTIILLFLVFIISFRIGEAVEFHHIQSDFKKYLNNHSEISKDEIEKTLNEHFKIFESNDFFSSESNID